MKSSIITIATATILFAATAVSGQLIQYTPDQADWSTFYSKPAAASSVIDHTPDGVTWLRRSKWKVWDGVPINPNSMTKKQFAQKICPSGDTILGLREVFYEHNPFADVKNPTKAEVDEWHRISIQHLRALVGNTNPIEKDHCLFARALWGQQRRFTRKWDGAYPSGTCRGSRNPHCGASFVPNAADQAPYLPPGHSRCRNPAGSEGVSGAPKSNIPWSIKWVRAFCGFLNREGFNGGHVGPFFRRTKFGWSFWDYQPNNQRSNAVFRGKWGGERLPALP